MVVTKIGGSSFSPAFELPCRANSRPSPTRYLLYARIFMLQFTGTVSPSQLCEHGSHAAAPLRRYRLPVTPATVQASAHSRAILQYHFRGAAFRGELASPTGSM